MSARMGSDTIVTHIVTAFERPIQFMCLHGAQTVDLSRVFQ